MTEQVVRDGKERDLLMAAAAACRIILESKHRWDIDAQDSGLSSPITAALTSAINAYGYAVRKEIISE